jgi:hypothetical protein
MSMSRTLAIGKRVSLEGIYEGWTSDAYAIVQPASYEDKIQLNNYIDSKITSADALQYELDSVKKHLISGKIFVLDDTGALKLDDLAPSDLDDMVAVTQRLFIGMSGLDADPKDTQTETATSSMPPASIDPSLLESNTKTE